MKSPKEVKSKFIQIRFRPTELSQLKKVAEELNYLSVSSFIRTIIREKLIKFGKKNGR